MKIDDESSEESVFTPIGGASSLVDQTYEQIRKGIVNRKIKPGAQLRQIQLAEQLGVSPRTVREALNRLVAGGLAIREPYKGVRVADLTAEGMVEIFQMRRFLEGWAMELAAETITDKELDRMAELLPKTVDPDPAAAARVREANIEFHMIPIKSTGKQHLVRVLEQLWSVMATYVLREVADVEERREAADSDLEFHRLMLEALKARDKERAGDIVRKHIDDTLSVNLGRIEIREE